MFQDVSRHFLSGTSVLENSTLLLGQTAGDQHDHADPNVGTGVSLDHTRESFPGHLSSSAWSSGF